MSRAVTWQYLTPEQTHKCLAASDKATLVHALKEASSVNQSKLLVSAFPGFPLEKEQELILLDLYVNLIRFSQGVGFSPEKTSTLLGIVAQTHLTSMSTRALNVQAYKDLESRLVAHSVHRPPFSAQIFSLTDAKYISDYLLNTYFRHYKLYMYSFTPQETAEVRTVVFAMPHHTPPVALPPMSKCVPLAQWEAAQEEIRKAEEERLQKLAAEEAAAREEAERLAAEAQKPNMTAGLKQQLDIIKTTVSKMSKEKLDDLESKLVALENRVAEVNKPMSAVGSSKSAVKPPSKK